MKLGQLDGLMAFVAVARHGSFRAAANALDISPAAVSQTVKQLEVRLGARLFNRSTRSVALTEAGAEYLDRVGPAVAELLEAGEAVASRVGSVSGLLRINCAGVVHRMLLRSLLPGLLSQHPGLRLELRLDDGFSDIVAAGFDAGIRLGESVQRDMVAVPLTMQEQIALVASPDYLARRGVPRTVADLAGHDCIRFRFPGSGAVYRWELLEAGVMREVAVDGPLMVSDSLSMALAAEDGLGIAYTFARYVQSAVEAGRLCTLLPEACPTLPGFYCYYPSRRQVPAKLRAFIDYCRSRLEEVGHA